MAINTFSLGFTTFMLSIIFDTKGTVSDMNMGGLPKVALPVIKDIPILGTMFANLTIVDYAAFVLAIVMYVIMYKTVVGFRLRAIGINDAAASSLGINVARSQIISTTLSGAMIGLAGCLLSLGAVTVFTQNISSARGYIALAANNLCQGHPIGALLSSALFGFTQSLGRVLQNTAVKQQLLECIPYIATISPWRCTTTSPAAAQRPLSSDPPIKRRLPTSKRLSPFICRGREPRARKKAFMKKSGTEVDTLRVTSALSSTRGRLPALNPKFPAGNGQGDSIRRMILVVFFCPPTSYLLYRYRRAM